MITQKQWRIQHLAGHMGNVAVSAAAEAARRKAERQSMVKEHAVVADEIRNISSKMIMLVEQNVFNKLDDNSFDIALQGLIVQSTFLALNAALVACKVLEHKPMAVFAEEVRNLTIELCELYGQTQQYIDIPVPENKNRVVDDTFFLIRAVSGSYIWCENARFVNEILLYTPELISNNRLMIKNGWRDIDAPFIKLGDVINNAGLVIITDDRDPNKQYAVLAEITVNLLANSYVGVSKSSASDIPVRECWIASDGSEMIFPDWEQLIL